MRCEHHVQYVCNFEPFNSAASSGPSFHHSYITRFSLHSYPGLSLTPLFFCCKSTGALILNLDHSSVYLNFFLSIFCWSTLTHCPASCSIHRLPSFISSILFFVPLPHPCVLLLPSVDLWPFSPLVSHNTLLKEITFPNIFELKRLIFSEGLTNVKGDEGESAESGAKDNCHIRRDGSGEKRYLLWLVAM